MTGHLFHFRNTIWLMFPFFMFIFSSNMDWNMQKWKWIFLPFHMTPLIGSRGKLLKFLLLLFTTNKNKKKTQDHYLAQTSNNQICFCIFLKLPAILILRIITNLEHIVLAYRLVSVQSIHYYCYSLNKNCFWRHSKFFFYNFNMYL